MDPPLVLQVSDYPVSCVGLARSSRGAVAYTDFEVFPVPGWASNGGIWFRVNGFKGYGLRGVDNNGGLGRASHYYYNTDLSTYSSLWVTVKTRLVSWFGWYGISMFNSGMTSLYTVEIRTTGYLEVWSYNVITANDWSQHASAPIPGYSPDAWYIIVVNYSVSGSTITFNVWLYRSDGGLATNLSTSITNERVFRPAYIGVEVNGWWLFPLAADFDDFAISAADPRNVTVANLPGPGYGVALVDNLGNVVAYGTSATTSLALGVVTDVVLGTGTDGAFYVNYPNGLRCLEYVVPSLDAVVGGDTYTLTYLPVTYTLGSAGASAYVQATVSSTPQTLSYVPLLRVSNLDSKPYYARLLLHESSSLDGLTARAYLRNLTHASTPVEISDGSVVVPATGWFEVPALSSDNYIYISASFPDVGYSATLNMCLQYCTLPSEGGVCVYYPLVVVLQS